LADLAGVTVKAVGVLELSVGGRIRTPSGSWLMHRG
jgi:hypothetical protein